MITETRVTLRNLGKINPLSIDDYIAAGGYDALSKTLKRNRTEVIEEIISSKLRGRGGAGFSTGLKKKFTSESRKQTGPKYLICNADEGEPGTFKDRIIMENDPHLLLEGMLIAGYSIGAEIAFVYIRGEYHESIEKVRKAIESARKKGFIGKNILGSGFSMEIDVRLGAGSYLCGEELTLLESLEGKRGYPRIKPPFPAEKGLFGMPTLVNNVETLATIPAIIGNGHEWYTKLGTEESPGTKIFTISGDVVSPGFFEVEMGTTLRQLIFELAGGMKKGKKLKAILTGGAAGTFVDETVLDTPIGFDSLKEKGAVLGSGALMVLGDDKSIPLVTQSILDFFRHESCGKCVPCRVGTDRLARMIAEFNKGKYAGKTPLDDMLAEADYMAKTSLCPLGQSPVMPLRSLKRYFSSHF